MALPPAPAPRLPLEPEPRSRYPVERRVGCSGMALVSAVALVAFVVFAVAITPRLLDQVRALSLPQVLGLPARATPTLLPAEGAPTPAPTPLPIVDTPEPTPVPPTATPEPEYVAIGNTAGDNVSLREAPRSDARRLIALRPRTVLRVIGADVEADGKLWRNVSMTGGDMLTGWVMAQYLVPADPP